MDPKLFLVHSPHLPSDSWDRTFGHLASPATPLSGTHSERFAAILGRYEAAKIEIDAEAADRRCPETHGRGVRNRKSLQLKRNTLGLWSSTSSTGATRVRRLYTSSDDATRPKAMRTERMTHALRSTIHALWYEYHPKAVGVVARLVVPRGCLVVAGVFISVTRICFTGPLPMSDIQQREGGTLSLVYHSVINYCLTTICGGGVDTQLQDAVSSSRPIRASRAGSRVDWIAATPTLPSSRSARSPA